MSQSHKLSAVEKKNAATIVELDRLHGHKVYNEYGQVVREVLNLSIPLAYLVNQGIVFSIANESCLLDENAVREMSEHVRAAIVWEAATNARKTA